MLKVFVGGEGTNDIGTRGRVPMGDQPGVVEVLLRRVRATGWQVAAGRSWQSIRKYRSGAARTTADHADAHNVLGLVLHAYEEACELLAFTRDGDDDTLREQEIRRVLDTIHSFGFASEFGYQLAIVGGIAKPKLEGWILCLLGVPHTDAMTRARVDHELAALEVGAKSTEQYVAIAETRALPTGDSSLCRWLADADQALRLLIEGTVPR